MKQNSVMYKAKRFQRLRRILGVSISILLIADILAFSLIDRWESNLNGNASSLEVVSAEFLPKDGAENSYGMIRAQMKNVGGKPTRGIPNLYFMDSNAEDAVGESLLPDSYYNVINAAGVENYDGSQVVPPGIAVTVNYPLTEQDALELETITRNQKTVYVRLFGFEKGKKFCVLQMQAEEE